MTSRGLARNASTDQRVSRDGKGDRKLPNVVDARRLPIADDPVDGGKRHVGCLRKLPKGPAPTLTEAIDSGTTRVRVFNFRHGENVPQNGTGVNGVPDFGTQDSDIIGDVPQRIHPDYQQLLVDLMLQLPDEGGVSSKTNRWRFKSSKPGAVPTVKAAETIRSALHARMPGVDIPPPIVPTRTNDHYTWIVLGEWFMENDPLTFRRLLERMKEIRKGTEAQFALGTMDKTHDPADDL